MATESSATPDGPLYVVPRELSNDLSSARPAVFGKSLFMQLKQVLNSPKRSLYAEYAFAHVAEKTGNKKNLLFISTTEFEGSVLVPLGHAAVIEKSGSKACPCVDLEKRDVRLKCRFPFMKVGVAVAVHDKNGKILITRRPKHMRIFPGAWVFPGGGIEPGELVVDAAKREVREETGLEVEVTSLISLWESVYPTTSEACIREGGIQGHHLVLYYSAILKEKPGNTLNLQLEEVNAAIWLSQEQVHRILDRQLPQSKLDLAISNGDHADIEEAQLHGIYPNKLNSGIAQGHLFAMEMMGRNTSAL